MHRFYYASYCWSYIVGSERIHALQLLVFFRVTSASVHRVCTDRFPSNFLSWWCHEMETFSALLAICAGNSPVIGEFSAQRPATRSFDVFFDLRLHIRLSKQSWGWWFETLSRPLWRLCNAIWIFALLVQTRHDGSGNWACAERIWSRRLSISTCYILRIMHMARVFICYKRHSFVKLINQCLHMGFYKIGV